MLKKIFYLFLLLFLTSCGYEPIYSKKNIKKMDFSIGKFEIIGDRQIGLKIKQKLNIYTLNKKEKFFDLKISSSKDRIVLSKNELGDPTRFQLLVKIKFEVKKSDASISTFTLSQKFSYDNNANRFTLKKYETEITNNLTETILDDLFFKLATIS